jgi:Na(+)-translocating NADH:ubiquinone oxidoreductase C subunit
MANEEAEEVKNILAVLEIAVDSKWDSKTLLDVYKKNVQVRKLGDLTVYEKVSNQSADELPSLIAVKFSGMGLWAPIDGVLSLENDFVTIRQIRFYKQEETPGLGGEIASSWFQEQFEGKRIVSNSGEPGIRIVKPGNPTDNNSVDGITGATMTSNRVETMLDQFAKNLWKERK